MRAKGMLRILLVGILVSLAAAAWPAGAVAHRHHGRHEATATVDQLLGLDVAPFAIGHRGFGENLGEDPSRPIEDTLRAVRRGFLAGISVVEVDVQLTRDGEVVVFHDDFLPDLTCINRLTRSQLRERRPEIPGLAAVLHEAKRLNQRSDPLRGLVIVELKAAAPLCDPHDTQERAIVSAVAGVIRWNGMANQVLLASFSPAMLFLAADEAPEIVRILSISGLQFLSPEQVEAQLRLPVTLIDKKLNLGLQWAEIGPIFRLPGYRSVDEVFRIAAVTTVRLIEADLFFLSSAGAPFVGAVHAYGMKALGFTANTPEEWFFLESLGLDGIYTNDIPFGVDHQAPIP